MSHISTVQTEVRDAVAAAAACRRLGWKVPVTGTAKLFSGRATGLIVHVPTWRYPAVFDTATGEVQFDNYKGEWGDQKLLNRFRQTYAVEKAKLEARKKGKIHHEQSLPLGWMKVTIQVTGGAP